MKRLDELINKISAKLNICAGFLTILHLFNIMVIISSCPTHIEVSQQYSQHLLSFLAVAQHIKQVYIGPNSHESQVYDFDTLECSLECSNLISYLQLFLIRTTFTREMKFP